MKQNDGKEYKAETIKAWRKTRTTLKIISAKRLQPMTYIIDELANAELQRLIELEKKNGE